MIKQNKTTLQFILGGALLLTIALTACDSGETKEGTKDNTTTTIVTSPAVRDSTDSMEKIPGKVAPGNDVKPQ